MDHPRWNHLRFQSTAGGCKEDGQRCQSQGGGPARRDSAGSQQVSTRRKFIARSSLGLVGVFALRDALRSASLAAPSTDGPVLKGVPKQEELAYPFGGVAPRHRIQSGTRIITWTEDCFDGAIKTSADLVSKVTVPGHDNPQTGPFYVEGAQAGDTLAIQILKLEPARDYAIST